MSDAAELHAIANALDQQSVSPDELEELASALEDIATGLRASVVRELQAKSPWGWDR